MPAPVQFEGQRLEGAQVTANLFAQSKTVLEGGGLHRGRIPKRQNPFALKYPRSVCSLPPASIPSLLCSRLFVAPSQAEISMSLRRARELLDRAEARRLVLPERGVEVALLDWGGAGPLALLHHANGFCKGLWALVAEGLCDRYRVIAMDARGHGDSSRPEGPAAYGWDYFSLDLAAVAERLLAECGVDRVSLGIGHSFGGTAFLGASVRRPELFDRILLVDPVTPARTEGVPPERTEHHRSLVDRARRRRAEWPSRAAAFDWWRERELFSEWLPEALGLYALDGLGERVDGSVELKCPGEVEAAVFAGSLGFDVASLVRGAPTKALFLWAKRGNFPLPLYQELAASMRDARVEEVDASHLIPMEQPDLVVEAAQRFAAEEG